MFRFRDKPLTLRHNIRSSLQLEVRPADRESVRLLVDAFNLYDRDNSGSICRDELRDVLRATGKNPTEGRTERESMDPLFLFSRDRLKNL